MREEIQYDQYLTNSELRELSCFGLDSHNFAQKETGFVDSLIYN